MIITQDRKESIDLHAVAVMTQRVAMNEASERAKRMRNASKKCGTVHAYITRLWRSGIHSRELLRAADAMPLLLE